MTAWNRKTQNTRAAYDDTAGDEPTRHEQLTSAEVQRAILTALADGPLSREELRDATGLNEQRIGRELLSLRDDGKAKPIGNLTRRKYALASYRPPFMTHPINIEKAKADAPPATSWWIEPGRSGDRAEFDAAVRARNEQMLNVAGWRQRKNSTNA